jgi:uncharacterized protein YceK
MMARRRRAGNVKAREVQHHEHGRGTAGLGKSKAEPPEYPLADIAFSAVLDTIILPVTFPVATYELVFE